MVCKKWTKRCSKSSPALPASGRQDFPFIEMDKKEYDMEKMMAEMKKMGMGMNMYGRDDMDELAEMGDSGGYGSGYGGDPYGGMGSEEDL